jgi:hypothetical protein
MHDSFGDGWNGASWTLSDSSGNTVAGPFTVAAGVSHSETFVTTATPLTAADDKCYPISLVNSFTFFDSSYSTVYFCTNGYISFDDHTSVASRSSNNANQISNGNNVNDFSDFTESVSEFRSEKMIASMWDDFDSRYGDADTSTRGLFHETVGTVEKFRWTVTPQYEAANSDSNTFMITLDTTDGTITITHGRVDALDGIVGVSNGIVEVEEVDFTKCDGVSFPL